MMITRNIKCRVCSKATSITYPEKLSEEGRYIISLCSACRTQEIRAGETSYPKSPWAGTSAALSAPQTT